MMNTIEIQSEMTDVLYCKLHFLHFDEIYF